MVALRKESVDRNCWITEQEHRAGVALRKESVDRNAVAHTPNAVRAGSLSARRAWIEIFWMVLTVSPPQSLSARRAWIEIAGSQNRNTGRVSLSARRAWIEIKYFPYRYAPDTVALRKESVDRNCALHQ